MKLISVIKLYLKPKNLIGLLLLVTFLKQLVFSAVVPIWHTPDEQAHFAQVAYLSEGVHLSKNHFDLNREILTSERLLGTERDNFGNNRFTYHPEYKIEYTKSTTGKYEQQITTIPIEFRQQMMKQEAANYPPLYYLTSTLFYKTFYNFDLIVRVYAVRFFSIILAVLTVFISWFLAKQLFPKAVLLQMALPILVAFQPMFSFVSAGVNSDNLFNCLFSLLILLLVLLVQRKTSKQLYLGIAINFFLLYLTKPQFILSIPMIFLAAFIFLLKRENSAVGRLKIILILMLSLGLVIALFSNTFFLETIQRLYPEGFVPGEPKYPLSLLAFTRETFQKIAHETLIWYWGVFDWLGVTYPIEIIRILNRIMILAGIGVVGKLIYSFFKKKDETLFIFILGCTLIYFLGIFYYDYKFHLGSGYSFGIQGRYFFPMIIAHQYLLLAGILFLIPGKFIKIKEYITMALVVGMITINFAALWLLANTYYDLASLEVFIRQVSQYKILVFKGNWFTFWLLTYIIGLTILLFYFVRISLFKVGKNNRKVQ